MADAVAIFTVKHKLSFDFGKMARKSTKIIDETLDKIANRSAKISRQNIDKGLKPPLTPFTMKMRGKGFGWSGERVPKTSSRKPLYQTGNLYNKIIYNKSAKALEMPAYGAIQNKGFIALVKRPYMKIKYIKVPARKFIATPSTGLKAGKEIKKIHFMKMHNALKKRK